jgi:osmoprotectant transport system substrate-binding protein
MKNWKKTLAALFALILGAGIFAGCSSSSSKEKSITIGSKDFTENYILAELYALALEDAGFSVDRAFGIASSAVHTALVSEEIDLYPEYTGTGLLSVLGLPLETDPQTVYDTVKNEYKEQFDLEWLDYSSATDSQGLVITTEAAEKYGISTISDLQKNASNLRFASQGEFDQREDGIPALEALYGPFEWASSKVYDNGLKYTVLSNGEADVAPAYTTEGQLAKEEFTLLEDDKKVWPPYNIAPVASAAVLEENPQIAEILNKVNALLDTKTLTELNARVDVEQQEYEEVAAEFYETIQEQVQS